MHKTLKALLSRQHCKALSEGPWAYPENRRLFSRMARTAFGRAMCCGKADLTDRRKKVSGGSCSVVLREAHTPKRSPAYAIPQAKRVPRRIFALCVRQRTAKCSTGAVWSSGSLAFQGSRVRIRENNANAVTFLRRVSGRTPHPELSSPEKSPTEDFSAYDPYIQMKHHEFDGEVGKFAECGR